MLSGIRKSIIKAAAAVKLRKYEKRMREEERAVGVVPRLVNFGDFLHGYESSVMSDYWHNDNLGVCGNNYWTLGKPESAGSSSRFSPNSRMYQAWLGAYTCLPDHENAGLIKDGMPDMGLVKRLAEIDQRTWLHLYGDPEPFAELAKHSLVGNMRIDSRPGWVYYGEIASHSDVGFSGPAHSEPYKIARRMRLDAEVNPGEDFFAPSPALWEGTVSPYHNILLKGFFAIVPVEHTVVCVYINGAEFMDSSGRHHDTWRSLAKDAMDIIESVKIEKI